MPPDDERIATSNRVAEQMLRIFEEGAPAVLRDVGPLFETDEVFEWIRRAHSPSTEKVSLQKIVALKRSWGLDVEPSPPPAFEPGRSAEIFRSGAQILDTSPFLPTEAHPSFEDWVRQTRDALGGEFGMQAPGLECTSFEALERLQSLLAPILAVTGPRTYRYNAFLGDYTRTPFGFHVDPHQEAVFQYVLHGRRKAFMWEGLTLSDDDAAWVEDTNGLRQPAREPEVTFDLEPGDLVFWPGTHVHGFEPVGPSMALSMVIDRASPRIRSEVVAELIVKTMGGRAALPAITERSAIAAGDTLERAAIFPIAYERYDDTLIVGVCGRSFDWPDRFSVGAAMRLFDFLNAHPRIVVSDVLDACADETLEADEILEVLCMLAGLGFLR
jgi:hypothetical protein